MDKTVTRSVKWLAMIAWACGFCLLLAPLDRSQAASPVPIEQTLAYRMLQRERAVRTLPASAETLLRTVLNHGLRSLGPNATPPRNAAEFRTFAEKVSVALAEHNFLQPARLADWPDTIGDAFRPIPRDDPRVPAAVNGDRPERRARLKPTGPLYFVDCDIGSMLIVSVAQMVGFDVAMVEVPSHNFIRWQSPSGESANWDWTYWTSPSDSDRRASLPPDLVSRKVFLASQTPAETEAYFKSVLAAKVDDQAAKVALRREAASAFANNRVVAYGVARTFALSSAASPADRRQSLAYGLLALSMEGNGSRSSIAHRMAVVACAYAANGDSALATAFGERALADAPGEDRNQYQANLAAIRKGERCPQS